MASRETALDVWDPRVAPEENITNWTGEPVLHSPREAPRRDEPLMVDLFSGAGGFSLGLAAAGFAPALGLDHHIPSARTYARAHPAAATILGDIRRVPEALIDEALDGRSVDLVTAGVPCQGFSLCNRKRHDADRRNFLFHEFIRVVRHLRPRAVILENVSGLRSADAGGFAARIEAAIAESGYHVEWRLLNAAEFGVPQERRRVFFVGLRSGHAFPWPRPTHGEGQRSFVTVWEAIGDLPPLEPGQSAEEYAEKPFSHHQRCMRRGSRSLTNHTAPHHPRATVERIARTAPGEPMYPRFRQRIRLHPDRPSPTQVSGGIRPQFSFGHPTQPRGLTVRERCRLQSFPDTCFIEGGTVQGRVQTGNAVPPLLAEAIGRALLRALG
ncbi:DNA cytosine methyltransferase [Candidatus Sumerlaeota bacterium]|nr:DNA cytosine methyltransferase [Candidatus Sumerlaeota bacterium]